MDLDLSGKTVIVTGGGSNIGRAVSLTFAKEGSNVVIAELDEVQGKKVADEANALGAGDRAMVIKTDITDIANVEAMIKKTIEEFEKIDVLVNVVGWDFLLFFTDTDPDFWDRVININYRGMLNCTKSVLPHMIEKKSGNIVSISSDAGRVGEVREAVYSGCKGAVIAFSKSVAREVGRYGIRLNVVCPGLTVPESDDEFGEESMWVMGKPAFTSEMKEKAAKGYALRKLTTPQDIANAVVFLSSDAVAGDITGQTLSVSGGYSMV